MTDLAESTGLMLALGDRYPALVKDYRRILREAAHGMGGHEVESSGDSCLFAFQRALRAVEAAVTAQRSVRDHDWPDGLRIGVAIGLHTGEPTVVEDGY